MIPNNIRNGFNAVIDGKQVKIFELKNKQGMQAYITNYGGRLISLFVLGKDGKLKDVVQGFDSIRGYQKAPEPYFGATISRYDNQSAKGKVKPADRANTLYVNNDQNTIHGGKKGFQDVVWDAKQLNPNVIELIYSSKEMEQGLLQNLQVKIIYNLTEDNSLKVKYEAFADKTTVINLSNHIFFNLNGENSGTILTHKLQIKSDRFLPIDLSFIPTGVVDDVTGTPFDFRKGFAIGSRINDRNEQLRNGKGYDHNYVLNPHSIKTAVANVIGDKSGIMMYVFTDQSGLQFYSGNFMRGENRIKGGHKDEYRTAFAMVTRHFPESPNQSDFPSIVLKPGQRYESMTRFYFTVNGPVKAP